MPTNINCMCFSRGKCLHAAAPRGWFGPPLCVIDNNLDPRITKCALQYPHKDPRTGKPNFPPIRIVVEGSSTEYKLP